MRKVALLVLSLIGCGKMPGEPDGGLEDLGRGPTDLGGGDARVQDGGPPPSVPQAARDQLLGATQAIGAARGLASPLVQDAEQLRDDPRSDRPTLERRQEAEARVEDAVSGNSIVTDPACVQFDWSLAMVSVAITFNGCILEATGEPLDGVLSLAVSFGPTRFALAFSTLRIGGSTLDGSIELTVGGRCRLEDTSCAQCRDTDPTCMSAQQNQRTLALDLVLTSSTSTTLAFDALTLSMSGTEVSVDGTGMLSSSEISGTLQATRLTAQNGECLPSSGTLALDDGSGLVYSATFLPTTPATGAVYLQVNGFPPLSTPPPEVTLFAPCP